MNSTIKRCNVANTQKSKRSKHLASFFHLIRRFSSSSFALIFLIITSMPDTIPPSRKDVWVFTSSPPVSVESIGWSSVVRAWLSVRSVLPVITGASLVRSLCGRTGVQDMHCCMVWSQSGISRRGYTWYMLSTAIWQMMLIPQMHMMDVRYMAASIYESYFAKKLIITCLQTSVSVFWVNRPTVKSLI